MILSSVTFAKDARDNADRYVEDQLLNNVVVIEGIHHDGRPILGLGMIIGRSDDFIWVATAKHVVFKEDQLLSSAGASPVKSLRAKFRNGITWQVAHPPERTMIDLAFFSLKVPRKEAGPDLWRENVEILNPAVGTEVRLAGLPRLIRYGESGAKIARIDPAGNLVIGNLNGVEGQSGAPVATTKGFVGMYVQSAGSRVIPMSRIKQEAASAGRPYMLLPAPAEATPVRLCLVNEDGIRDLPAVVDNRDIKRPDKHGCVATISGPARLRPSDMGISCQPQQFELSAQPHQSLRIVCSIDPAGIWRLKGDGYVEVKKINEELWSIEGFTSRFGNFSGALRGPSTSLTTELRMGAGLSLHGQIELSPRRMTGNLSGTGGTWQLELRR